MVENLIGMSLTVNRIWKSYKTRRGMIPRGNFDSPGEWVSYPPGRLRKVGRTCRNLNQNRNFFNHLVSRPGRFEWWKKGGRKSRWTVPIKDTCNPHKLMFNLSANHWVFVSQIPILSKIQRPDHLVTRSLYTQTGSGEGVVKLIIVQDKSPHPFFFPLVWNEKKEKESLHNNYYPSVVQ